MPGMLGDLIVLVAVAVAAGLAVRSVWKAHQSGGGCSGDCEHCGGCRGKS